ncbi:B-4DMT family transporter [Candidatus Mycobacterium wuenschmannii]|uniref:B-4DMT family transporter n=1 Tax=Candidatus Mycobacterium wuenschmannii TaxID=3027808 RepID=A0ABY8VYM3_9MYCO|nr:B-4DMT family transporter [Candidatus Mycobacterium wuenschmannii]WIM88577.1 B-4DMT family transporter [Candidatus Mycobacterium wuenschmannii]
MTNWMLRGLVFAGAMVVVRVFQGSLISVLQTQATLISLVLLALFIVGVVIWGLIDGREDAASTPDPDRREDLAMTWLLAGLIAGLLSGVVTWLIAVFYKAVYVGGLINELTTFAAFTALVVFVGAICGVAVGRWRVDRAGAYKPQAAKTGGDDERADTDVFAAVRGDQAATEGGAVAEWPEEQTSSVATAEREYEAPTAYSQESAETSEAPAAHDTEKTETLPAHEPATEHIEKPKTD